MDANDGSTGPGPSGQGGRDSLLDLQQLALPGALLLGFQLTLAFQRELVERLSWHAQVLYLLTVLLELVAVALLAAPAASRRWAVSRLVAGMPIWGALALALGVSGSMYLAALSVTGREAWAVALGLLSLVALAGLWFAVPWAMRGEPVPGRGEGEADSHEAAAGRPDAAASVDDLRRRLEQLERDLIWHHRQSSQQSCPWSLSRGPEPSGA